MDFLILFETWRGCYRIDTNTTAAQGGSWLAIVYLKKLTDERTFDQFVHVYVPRAESSIRWFPLAYIDEITNDDANLPAQD